MEPTDKRNVDGIFLGQLSNSLRTSKTLAQDVADVVLKRGGPV